MKILVAVIFFAFLATPSWGFSFLIGSLRCVGGPSQWCRDAESARACRAEKYCRDKVWKSEADVAHNIRRNDAGEVIFSSLDDKPFKTMEKIMEMQMKEMEGVMKSFMGGDGNIFDGFFDGAIEDLKRFEDAKTEKSNVDNNNEVNNINSIITFSNIVGNELKPAGNGDDNEHDERITDENDDVCGACVNITTMIRDELLTKANEAAITAALEGLCKKLGPVEEICDETVKSYVPKYFEMARNFMNNPKLLCEFAGLCKPGLPFKDVFANFPSMQSSSSEYQVSAQACSMCSTFSQGMKTFLKVPGLAENLPSTMCALMKEEGDEDCLELTTSFVEVFHEHLDPALVCASSFCANSRVDFVLEDAEERIREKEAPKTTEPPTTTEPTTTPPPPPPKPLPRVCRRCIHHTRMSLHFMEKKLWHDRRRWLWGCKFALNKTKCVEAVNALIDKAEERLKKTCPHKVCAKMGFCPPVNCTGSDQPHDHVETEAESSSGESVRGVPMMKLEPAVDFVPMLKVEKLAHAVGDDVKSDACTYCEEAVNYAKILLSNPNSKQEVEQVLLGLCKQVGAFKEICDQFVEQHLDQLIDKIAHMDTKQTCISLHLCAGPSDFRTLMSSVAAASTCNACKSFVRNGVMPHLSASGSERDFALGACHSLGFDNLLCHKHLANFLAIARTRLSAGGSRQAEEAEESVCRVVCRPGTTAEWEQCLATTTEDEATSVPTTLTTEAPPTQEPPPQPPACKRCIAALTLIKSDLTKKLGCLEGKLTAACSLLPPLKAECTAAVAAFFAPLKDKVAKVKPEAVCVKVGVCIPMTTTKSTTTTKTTTTTTTTTTTKPDLKLGELFGGIGPVIPAAEDSFPDLEVFGGNRPDFSIMLEDAQKSAATKASKADDGKIRVGGKRPSAASAVGIHRQQPSQVQTMDSVPRQAALGGAACSVCTYLINDLKASWTVVSKEELKAVLMKGCAEMPNKQRDECIDFMGPHLDSLVDDIVKKIPAEEICRIQGIACPKACPSDEACPLKSKFPSDSMRCYACKFAAEELKDVWSNPNVPSTINNTLHSICLKLPVEFQTQCHGAIDQTFPIIDGMLKEMQPEAVCASIGICEAAKRHLLGADECTWHLTPADLCADWKRAKRCRGIDFCKSAVWDRN